jgi:hypothetical protein
MTGRLVVAALVAGLFGSVVGPVRAEVTAEQVRQAIAHGTAYLLEQQRADGSWPEMVGQNGGISALSTLALLNAGVDPDNEKIQRALLYLRRIPAERTYVVSLQTMVFARATPDRDRALIARNVRWLERTQLSEGPYRGAWTYPGLGAAGDNSNTQFALLGLFEAERVGVPANPQTWRLAKAYWERVQNEDGSWSYNLDTHAGTGSMTCAGITSLVIAADRVQLADARVNGDHIECCLPRSGGDSDRIERGLQWLGRHYSVTHNPGENRWTLYYLYGLERAGRLTARRFLALPVRPGRPDRADWYREGAEWLVHRQEGMSGFWRAEGPAEIN